MHADPAVTGDDDRSRTPRRRLTVRAGRFERDGQPHRVVSGALHYFRIHPDLWGDRLRRVAALGVNTVETYVPWNWHERRPGRARVDGWRDLPRFVELAGELGLDVIVRPGPYICAEWDFGGLPAWLLRGGPARLRCTDPTFVAAVDRWYDEVVPRLVPLQSSRGGPVVAVQVENEYGSFGDDRAYLRFCRDGLLRRGIDVLLMTSDGAGPDYLASGTVDGALPTANFGSRPAEGLAALRAFDPAVPQMVMELWAGWFDHWGHEHHVRPAAEVAGLVDEVLAADASLNLYLAHGGTSFGLWNGANVVDGEYRATVTSYDYGAAIGEAGELTDTFWAVRDVITRHTGVEPPCAPPPLPRLSPQRAVVERWGGLLDNPSELGPSAVAPMPLSLEELGVDHGLVLYRGEVLVPPDGGELRLEGLADRAVVLADNVVIGVLDRNEPAAALRLTVRPDGGATALDVLVENQGRVNYGHDLGERKGLRGVRLGRRFVHGWECIALPLDAEGFVERLRLDATRPPSNTPAVAEASFVVDTAADGFLALPGWGKGFLWLNGFLLGRYWSIGPQRTLYAPAPLWRSGRNVVTVLELHEPGSVVELRDRPHLGATSAS